MMPQEEDEKHLIERESWIPLMLRARGTVIFRIWYQILLVALYTCGIVCIHFYVDGFRMNFPQTLIPVLGVVTGLLLVFRTNTAYDRYWEGRRIWSQMTLNIRTLTRCIWIGVKEQNAADLIEKSSAVNLLVAFAYATKHYLREEYDCNEEASRDLRELISHIPKFATPSSNQPLDAQKVEKSKSTKPKHSKYNYTAYDLVTPSNIPIELSYYIASYIDSIRTRKDVCDSGTISIMNSALTSLVECLTGFERILRTPIPLAYSVHLHHSIWLYLLALPYQLVGSLGWWTIPAVTLASFSLLGILGIGWEIENPFGDDPNDLPLNDFCKVIKREIQVIMAHEVPTPDSWILSNQNPIARGSHFTANELANKSIKEVRDILAKAADNDTNISIDKSELRENFFRGVSSTDISNQRKNGKDKHKDNDELVAMLEHDKSSSKFI